MTMHSEYPFSFSVRASGRGMYGDEWLSIYFASSIMQYVSRTELGPTNGIFFSIAISRKAASF